MPIPMISFSNSVANFLSYDQDSMDVSRAKHLIYKAWKQQEQSWQAQRIARCRFSAALNAFADADIWVDQADIQMGRLSYSLCLQGFPVTAYDGEGYIHVDAGLFHISFFLFPV